MLFFGNLRNYKATKKVSVAEWSRAQSNIPTNVMNAGSNPGMAFCIFMQLLAIFPNFKDLFLVSAN